MSRPAASSRLQLRVDPALQERFAVFCAERGVSASQACRAAMQHMIETGDIPQPVHLDYRVEYQKPLSFV